MRFTKILPVCFGLAWLVGASTYHGSAVAGAAKPLLKPVIAADGTDPMPIPPLMADGTDPMPIPPLMADGTDPMPIPPLANGFAA